MESENWTAVPLVAQEPIENKGSSEKQNSIRTDMDSVRQQTKNYNRWSLNLNGGINVPVGPFTEGHHPSYTNYLNNPDFNHVNFNVRKMFNTQFGLMWSFDYNRFSGSENIASFNNTMYTSSVQGSSIFIVLLTGKNSRILSDYNCIMALVLPF